MDIKAGNSLLYQTYTCLRILTEFTVIVLLERGYTYHQILSHILIKCTGLPKLRSAGAINNIFKVVSGLLLKNLANLLKDLRQRRWQEQ